MPAKRWPDGAGETSQGEGHTFPGKDVARVEIPERREQRRVAGVSGSPRPPHVGWFAGGLPGVSTRWSHGPAVVQHSQQGERHVGVKSGGTRHRSPEPPPRGHTGHTSFLHEVSSTWDAQERLSAQDIYWGLVTWAPCAWHGPKFQTPRRKAGVRINHAVCADRPGTVSPSYPSGSGGSPCEIQAPRQQPRAHLSEEGSLRAARSALFHTQVTSLLPRQVLKFKLPRITGAWPLASSSVPLGPPRALGGWAVLEDNAISH